MYDAPLPVRPHTSHYRPGSYSAPASPLTGPRVPPYSAPTSPLTGPRVPPAHYPVSEAHYPTAEAHYPTTEAQTGDRRPTDAGVRCAAEVSSLRRASVAGSLPSSPPWCPAETLARRVSESAGSSPALSRAGSLDRRGVRRYTAAAAARLYSSLRLLRGKRDGRDSTAEGEARKEPEMISDQRVQEYGRVVPAQYQYNGTAEYSLAGSPRMNPELRTGPGRVRTSQ